MLGYSVVIPAYNAADTISETLKSVASQTVAPAEIVVVDDGSTDETGLAVLRSGIEARYMRQDNAGPGSATTKGFAEVSSPLVATVDADDIWLPGKMERQLRHLQDHPGVAGVFSHWVSFVDGNPEKRSSQPKPGWLRSTMLIRREMAEIVGPIRDPEGGRGEMVDWLARARETGLRLDMLDEFLVLRRVRPGSLSYGRDDRDRGYLQVVRQAMLRRRQQNPG